MKRWLVLPIAVLTLLFISATPALADEGQGGGGDNQSGDNQGGDNQNGDNQGGNDGNSTHFGPFASASTDSGTCGPDWANDTFNRSFTVSPNADGSFAVREDFTKGKFTTIAGSSPGACNTMPPPTGNGSLVRAGVTGRFHGYLAGTVTGGTFNENGCSSGGCDTTAGFVAKVFGPTATFSCVVGPNCSFFFTYRASDQGLIAHHWINASADKGGNSGDIASS